MTPLARCSFAQSLIASFESVHGEPRAKTPWLLGYEVPFVTIRVGITIPAELFEDDELRTMTLARRLLIRDLYDRILRFRTLHQIQNAIRAPLIWRKLPSFRQYDNTEGGSKVIVLRCRLAAPMCPAYLNSGTPDGHGTPFIAFSEANH